MAIRFFQTRRTRRQLTIHLLTQITYGDLTILITSRHLIKIIKIKTEMPIITEFLMATRIMTMMVSPTRMILIWIMMAYPTRLILMLMEMVQWTILTVMVYLIMKMMTKMEMEYQIH